MQKSPDLPAPPWMPAVAPYICVPREVLLLDVPPAARPFAPSQAIAFYDGPLIFWLRGEGRTFLATALGEPGLGPWPFLLSEMTATQVEEVTAGRVTLMTAALQCQALYFLPDYGAPTLELTRLSRVPHEWAPGDVFL